MSAEENKQMMLYSLGGIREFDYMYDIERVEMTIFQPRLDSISTFIMTVADLLKWVDEELKPRAALAFDGLGEFVPGSHCRFCKANAVCKANADKNLELAKYDFKAGALLGDNEIVDILNKADAFTKWIKAVKDYTLFEAITNDKNWPGYKLVEGRSNRAYADEATVAAKLIDAGWADDVIYKKKLLGLTEMTGLLSKPLFEKTLGELIVKPAGKPTLVPVEDKRPLLDKVAAALADFSDADIDA